ncbi:MAG: hypothetical protein Q7S03_00280 [bacterium]|nr:hypothetical protein [bacterium]
MTIKRLEELLEKGKKVQSVYKAGGEGSPLFIENVQDYARDVLSFTSIEMLENYFSGKIPEAALFDQKLIFLGVVTYGLDGDDFEGNFKKKLRRNYQKEKHLTTDLPINHEIGPNQLLAVAVFELKL